MQHHGIDRFVAILLALFLTTTPGSLFSQPPPSELPVSAVDAVQAAQSHPVIYVPYSNLAGVFRRPDASILIPLQDYLATWQKAMARTTVPFAQPPVNGLIASAKYTGRIEQDLMRLSVEYEVHVLKDGWVELPVQFGDAAIGQVQAEPGPVWLRGTGNGQYAMLLSKPGVHRVTLELNARIHTGPDGQSVRFPIPAAGISTLDVTIPQPDQSVELEPRSAQQTLKTEAESTHLQASLGAAESLSIRWHSRVGNKPDMDVLASATAATAVTVETGIAHADAHFQVDVLRGEIEQLRIAIPLGQRILDVASDVRIKNWTVAEEAGRQVVTAFLLNRTGGKIPLEVHTEWTTTDEPFNVAGMAEGTAHGIHLLDVLRESGQVAVRAASGMMLNIQEQTGLARVEEGEADPRLRKPGAYYFRYYSPACQLTVSAKPVEPRLLVEQRADVTIERQQVKLLSTLNYTIERASLFELKVKLPEGMTLDSVVCDGLKQYELSDDKTTLTVILNEGRVGGLTLQIQLRGSSPEGTEATPLVTPVVEPLGVEFESGTLRIFAPDSLEVVSNPASVVGFQPDPAPVQASGPTPLSSAWKYQRRPLAMELTTRIKPTRLSAQVATTLNVNPNQTSISSLVTYRVEYAGLDTFRIEVPEAVADEVQIHGDDSSLPSIRQRSRSAAVDGWVTWTMTLQREVTGTVPFRVTYLLKPPAESGQKNSLSVAVVRALDPLVADPANPAARQVALQQITGELTVRKDLSLSVVTTASGEDVELIDVRELQQLPADGFVAYRYYRQPVSLQVDVSRYDIQKVLETVASRGLVEVVLDRSGLAIVRSRYVVRSSERQRLRVDLPKGIKLLGAELDGKSVALELNPEAKPSDGWDAFFVNVARTKSSDDSFHFAVQYRVDLTPAPFHSRGGALQIRIPVLGGSGGNVPVQQLRTVIWTPDEFSLIGKPPTFDPVDPSAGSRWRISGQEQAAEQERWIGVPASGMFDFPVEGRASVYSNLGGRPRIDLRWWHVPSYTWIVSGALIIIAWVLRLTSWENKLTLLILAVFAAAVTAIQDPDLIMQGLAVSQYGLMGMAALWLVQAVWGPSRSRSSPDSGNPPKPNAPVIPPPGIFDSVTLGMQKS